MKRTFLFLLAAILLGAALQSCEKEDNNGNNNGGNNNGGGNGNGTTSVQWVDLGLPSGLLWADRNVGAKNAEDYGNYYAWGETASKEVYNWSTYAYSTASEELIKYCYDYDHGLNDYTDTLTILEPSDDAATVNIGKGARTPTKDEWNELMHNTTSTWTTRNGVHGRLLTASNGKSLFLPAAGRYGSSFFDAGEYGYFWSSTLHMVHPTNAWYFCIGSDRQYIVDGYRVGGFSVRAVRSR